MSSIYLIAPLVAFVTGWVALQLVRRVALFIGFVDNPDSRRKLHQEPIPLGGGAAVWVALWIGWTCEMFGPSPDDGSTVPEFWFRVSLAAASFVTLILGLIDDKRGLRGSHKLVGQFIAAAILVGSGLRMDSLSALGVVVDLGVFAVPVTLFVIILVINAFNLIDGHDGFCGSIAFVTALTLAFLGYRSGQPTIAVAGLAMAGALAAFLTDNLPPARIYLGDAGSMTLGLLIAALAIRGCSNGPATAVSIPALVALLALPLMDVVTALGRRWLTGRSLFVPDRGHLHHRLRSRLGNSFLVLGVAAGLALVGSAGAILARHKGSGDHMACLAVLISIVLLAGTDTFGGSELRLLFFRLRPGLTAFLTNRTARRQAIRYECHLHGNRDWSNLWSSLIRDVEAADLHRVELSIDLPALAETFYALYASPTETQGRPEWSIVHTLHLRSSPAGVIRVAGSAEASRTQYLEKVERLVRDLELNLEAEMGLVLDGSAATTCYPVIPSDPAPSPRFEPSLA